MIRSIFRPLGGCLLALSLAACSPLATVPGIDIEVRPASPADTATPGLSQADLQATIDAQVQATVEVAVKATVASLQPTSSPPTPLPAKPTNTPIPARPAATATAHIPDPASDPGEVVVVGRNGRLSVLANGTWNIPSLPDTLVSSSCERRRSDLGFDADGHIWLHCGSYHTLLSTDGGKTWDHPPQVHKGWGGRFFFGPDGRIVAPNGRYVDILDKGIWKEFDQGDTPAYSATFGRDGKLWLGGPHSPYLLAPNDGTLLLSFDNERWNRYGTTPEDVGLTKQDFIRALLVNSKGQLLAATGDKLLQLEDRTFKVVVATDQFTTTLRTDTMNDVWLYRMIEVPNGDIWLATNEGIFVWNGSSLTLLDREQGLPSNRIRDLALDAKGRVWAATSYGIAVEDGGQWRYAIPGKAALPDSEIVALAVTGAPKLPLPDLITKTTTIIGQALSVGGAGAPIANSPVQLCSEVVGINQHDHQPDDPPCAHQLYAPLAKTDAEGRFVFQNVPIGRYAITIQNSSVWYAENELNIIALEPGKEVQYELRVP